MARASWMGPGGRLKPHPLNVILKHLGGTPRAARWLRVSRSMLHYWRKGNRPIPVSALDEFVRLLGEIEAGCVEARMYLREQRPRSEAAEARWRARLYRRNRAAAGDVEAEAGLPGDPGRGD